MESIKAAPLLDLEINEKGGVSTWWDLAEQNFLLECFHSEVEQFRFDEHLHKLLPPTSPTTSTTFTSPCSSISSSSFPSMSSLKRKCKTEEATINSTASKRQRAKNADDGYAKDRKQVLESTMTGKKEKPVRWIEAEEVILEGVVTDCNILCGSLAPWKQVHKCYELAVKNYLALHPTMAILPRTTCALKKHYRVMHNKTRLGELDQQYWYEIYNEKWMSEQYNRNQQLISYENFVKEN